MPPLSVRPATAEDIAAFSDMPNKPSARAWLAELDGRIVAMGGLILVQGRWFAFLDLLPEMRPYKMTLARNAIRFLAAADRSGIKFIYADADLREPTARHWLASLGFVTDPRTGLYRRKLAK